MRCLGSVPSTLARFESVVRPTGEILFLGEGTGRPKNTLSSPEKAAGEVAERVFEKVFKR